MIRRLGLFMVPITTIMVVLVFMFLLSTASGWLSTESDVAVAAGALTLVFDIVMLIAYAIFVIKFLLKELDSFLFNHEKR